jgi:hypothetical protein
MGRRFAKANATVSIRLSVADVELAKDKEAIRQGLKPG